MGNQHIVKIIGGQAYISRNQAIEDAKKMAECLLELEQRMHDIHIAATRGEPDPKAYPFWKRIMPGFKTRVRLAHVAGLTKQFENLANIQAVDGPVQTVSNVEAELPDQPSKPEPEIIIARR